MIAVLRFVFVIPIGFVLACAAASFALLWPFVNTAGAAEGDPLFWLQIVVGFGAQAAQVGSTALVPWGVFVAGTELLGLRSLVLHAVAGLVGGFTVMRIAYAPDLPHGSVQTAMSVAGLTFGLVYWIVAGRGAGRWRPTRAPRPAVETAPTP